MIMTVLGLALFVIGCLVGLAGEIRFLVITYRHGPGWFLTCLLIPLVGWAFFLFYTKEAWRPVALSIGGFIVAGTGYCLGGFTFLS